MWGCEKGEGCPIFGRAWKPMTPPSAPSPKAFLNRSTRSLTTMLVFSFDSSSRLGGGWIFEAWLRCPRVFDILSKSEETESGSAGKQPDKGYSGRRCAKGAAGPRAVLAARGRFVTALWTPEPCLKKSFSFQSIHSAAAYSSADSVCLKAPGPRAASGGAASGRSGW